MDKTVYVLGAGFSLDAGAPPQSRIVNDIIELHNLNPHLFLPDRVSAFTKFLTNTMNIPPAMHADVPLEDIFTPLDRCIADNISFRELDIIGVKYIRETIYYLIGVTLKFKLENVDKHYIDKFAEHLFNKSIGRKKGGYKNTDTDKVAVISTNWDILLDNSINAKIFRSGEKAVVDYCCHISSFDENNVSVKPGLEILAEGGFNIKLLKLHGSYNWLQCPRCLRVYIEFDQKIGVDQIISKVRCRHCKRNFGDSISNILVSNLIMPTFLKDFSNPQYKLIWQNAGVELAEAERIVFIGYSLPQADFEMRQLLSRMIRSNAKIEVVTKGHKDNQSTNDLKQRYNVFFGSRNIKFFLNGTVDYIENNLR